MTVAWILVIVFEAIGLIGFLISALSAIIGSTLYSKKIKGLSLSAKDREEAEQIRHRSDVIMYIGFAVVFVFFIAAFVALGFAVA